MIEGNEREVPSLQVRAAAQKAERVWGTAFGSINFGQEAKER